MIPQLPNLLLIAGTGRNTGKTLLASSIIEKFTKDFKITGLKISPHFHSGTESLEVIFENKNFNIYQETSLTSSKDSSRMLNAGAHQVFYMECYDEYMKEAFEKFLQISEITGPMVCESPALRKYVQPGIFIIVDNQSNQNKKQDVMDVRQKADLFIETDIENYHPLVDRLIYCQDGWALKSDEFQL